MRKQTGNNAYDTKAYMYSMFTASYEAYSSITRRFSLVAWEGEKRLVTQGILLC